MMTIDIGERIKRLRLLHGLTQQELGDRCDLTKGFISQLESNQTLPSLPTLGDILEVLGISFAQFFAHEPIVSPVYRSADMFTKEMEGSRLTWLISTAQKNAMEPVLLELEAGQEAALDTPHDGEEFGYVLRGNITLCLGMQVTKLKKGDAFYYKADKQHQLKNSGKTGATVLWVSTPPSF